MWSDEWSRGGCPLPRGRLTWRRAGSVIKSRAQTLKSFGRVVHGTTPPVLAALPFSSQPHSLEKWGPCPRLTQPCPASTAVPVGSGSQTPGKPAAASHSLTPLCGKLCQAPCFASSGAWPGTEGGSRTAASPCCPPHGHGRGSEPLARPIPLKPTPPGPQSMCSFGGKAGLSHRNPRACPGA